MSKALVKLDLIIFRQLTYSIAHFLNELSCYDNLKVPLLKGSSLVREYSTGVNSSPDPAPAAQEGRPSGRLPRALPAAAASASTLVNAAPDVSAEVILCSGFAGRPRDGE